MKIAIEIDGCCDGRMPGDRLRASISREREKKRRKKITAQQSNETREKEVRPSEAPGDLFPFRKKVNFSPKSIFFL